MSILYRRITLQLPDHWTPEQALAVYDLLSDLVDAIWHRYELPLIEQLSGELEPENTAQRDLFDFDDSIPF